MSSVIQNEKLPLAAEAAAAAPAAAAASAAPPAAETDVADFQSATAVPAAPPAAAAGSPAAAAPLAEVAFQAADAPNAARLAKRARLAQRAKAMEKDESFYDSLHGKRPHGQSSWADETDDVKAPQAEATVFQTVAEAPQVAEAPVFQTVAEAPQVAEAPVFQTVAEAPQAKAPKKGKKVKPSIDLTQYDPSVVPDFPFPQLQSILWAFKNSPDGISLENEALWKDKIRELQSASQKKAHTIAVPLPEQAVAAPSAKQAAAAAVSSVSDDSGDSDDSSNSGVLPQITSVGLLRQTRLLVEEGQEKLNEFKASQLKMQEKIAELEAELHALHQEHASSKANSDTLEGELKPFQMLLRNASVGAQVVPTADAAPAPSFAGKAAVAACLQDFPKLDGFEPKKQKKPQTPQQVLASILRPIDFDLLQPCQFTAIYASIRCMCRKDPNLPGDVFESAKCMRRDCPDKESHSLVIQVVEKIMSTPQPALRVKLLQYVRGMVETEPLARINSKGGNHDEGLLKRWLTNIDSWLGNGGNSPNPLS
jgi:hypothetical protein